MDRDRALKSRLGSKQLHLFNNSICLSHIFIPSTNLFFLNRKTSNMSAEENLALRQRFELLKGAEHHKNALIEVGADIRIHRRTLN